MVGICITGGGSQETWPRNRVFADILGKGDCDWEFTESSKSSKGWLGFRISSDWKEALSNNLSLDRKEEGDPAVKSGGKTTRSFMDCRDEK